MNPTRQVHEAIQGSVVRRRARLTCDPSTAEPCSDVEASKQRARVDLGVAGPLKYLSRLCRMKWGQKRLGEVI